VGIYFNGSVKLVEMKQHFGADTSKDRRSNKNAVSGSEPLQHLSFLWCQQCTSVDMKFDGNNKNKEYLSS